MKTFLFIPALSVVAYSQHHPALLSDPPDGSAPPAREVRYALKPADVLETTTTRQGDRNITVQRLALDPDDPIVSARRIDTPAASPQQGEPSFATPAFLLMLSATVYPGPHTFLSWTHQFPDGSAHEYSGWSNVDFNHFTGITTFLGTDGEAHSFVMGTGTEQEPSENAPEFSSDAPTFLPDQDEIPAKALLTVDSLHKLYTIEKDKLAAAHEGRKVAEAARAAELLANPPQPKDLIIRYRIAETPLENEGGAQ